MSHASFCVPSDTLLNSAMLFQKYRGYSPETCCSVVTCGKSDQKLYISIFLCSLLSSAFDLSGTKQASGTESGILARHCDVQFFFFFFRSSNFHLVTRTLLSQWSFWFNDGCAHLLYLLRVSLVILICRRFRGSFLFNEGLLIFFICSGLRWSFFICWGLCWSFRFAESYADHLSLPFAVGPAGEESRGTEHLVQLNAPMSFVEGEEIYKVLLIFTKPAECFRKKVFSACFPQMDKLDYSRLTNPIQSRWKRDSRWFRCHFGFEIIAAANYFSPD